MGKISFLVGAAAGYVLGTRAGKRRYEQIKRVSSRVWSSQPVQNRVGDATTTLKRRAAPFVADKLGDAAKAVSRSMRETAASTREPARQERTDGGLHAAPDSVGSGEAST